MNSFPEFRKFIGRFENLILDLYIKENVTPLLNTVLIRGVLSKEDVSDDEDCE